MEPEPEVADYTRWSVSELKARLFELTRKISRLKAEKLSVIAALDEKQACISEGHATTAQMLAEAENISVRNATETVETATALEVLPVLRDAYISGRLSEDVVSEVAKFAAPDTEAELVEMASHWSPRQAKDQARKAREITPADQNQINAARRLKISWNSERTMMDLSARLTAEGGSKVASMLEKMAKRAGRSDSGKDSDASKLPFEMRMADALVELATREGEDSRESNRSDVYLHIDYETLIGDGTVELGAGYVSAELARRICCDSRLYLVLDDPYGQALGVGRGSRTVPHWLSAQIYRRDRTCQFPGCEKEFNLEIHHIVFWSEGGRTDYDNLVLVCWAHHCAIHEGGWRLTGSVRDGLVFTKPWGGTIEVAPYAMRHKRKRPRAVVGAGGATSPPLVTSGPAAPESLVLSFDTG